VILADLGARLAGALRAAAAEGEFPAPVARLTASGTWRRPAASPGNPARPGSYASSMPFEVAAITGRHPAEVAEVLAGHVGLLPPIASVRPSGGYLTVTVTTEALAALAARIAAVGPAAAQSDALSGAVLWASSLADPALALEWAQAWRARRDALVGRLARAAGAEVHLRDFERCRPATAASRAERGPVAAAVAYHGADAVGYALARTASPDASVIERWLCVPLDLGSPFAAVRYAHADAASVRRWATDLGLVPVAPARPPGGPQPPELALLDLLSWLPERVAAGARRGRPADLTAHLERLAAAWITCRERCPALPFGGHAAPADPVGTMASWRFTLADAARTAFAAGLDLLGVTAPNRP
jgi:arginyl-tRNA synthetase